MRILLLGTLIFLGIAIGSVAAQEPPPLNRFPTAEVSNLVGEEKSIPADLANPWSIVTFWFLPEHESAALQWQDFIRTYITTKDIDAVSYNMILAHTLSEKRQKSINAQIAAAVSELMQEQTFVLYEDRFKFIREYGIDQRFGPYILLVMPDGVTHTITHGNLTENSKQIFKNSLTKAETGP